MTDQEYIDAPLAPAPKTSDLPLFDAARYAHHLENTSVTEEQKAEFLRTLWWIMAAFVDLGFGVDSVQRVLPGLSELTSEFGANALEPVDPQCNDEFNGVALETTRKGSEEDGD